MPPGVTAAQAMAFFERHRPWAEKKWVELNRRLSQHSTEPGDRWGSTLPWQGREVPLRITEEARNTIRVAIDDEVRITLPQGLESHRDAVIGQALFGWVRRWLRERVGYWVQQHSPRFGLRPRDIRIKRMTSRWGSCGPRNDLNINWLLAFTPESVLEYVVVHELCHIRERNHSPAFWSLVSEHLPGYSNERRWLKAHGASLIHRFSV